MASPSVDMSNFKVCGQIFPKEMPKAPVIDASNRGLEALDDRFLWPNGSTLKVKIIGASPFIKGKIQQFANEWSSYANLNFSFVDSGDADIRVTTTPGGSGSVIGTTARGVPQDQQTMNFGWFNDQTPDQELSRVIVHEFGHAIGCIHEQSSPVANIPWNKPVVYAYYLKNNGWDQATVDAQVFSVASQTNTIETPFDRTSIMEYAYPPEFTTDGSSAPWNLVLSPLDKKFIMQVYPNQGLRRTTTDGVYFVNCFNGDQIASGVAWYKNMGNNDGQRPDAYVDVRKGSLISWEAAGGSGTFPDNNTVSWEIINDAGWLPAHSHVGTAKNNFENWNVYKDQYRLLYEIDGWKCFTCYWCF